MTYQSPEIKDITVADGYHVPVLLQESVEALQIDPAGVYVDCTFGGGGHSREILSRLGPEGRLIAFDQDEDARKNLPEGDDRIVFIRSNFRYLENFLHYMEVEKVDGILADLGVSSHHFDDPDRGFSFRFDAPLDMRMNRDGAVTAIRLLQEKSLEELRDIFKNYGELRNAHAIAKRIKEATDGGTTIESVDDFLKVLSPVVRETDKKSLAKVFQALRIEINDEIGALYQLLESSLKVLKPGGRLVVITYHSLEDRPVKNFIKVGNVEGERRVDMYGNVLSEIYPLTSKPIVPTQEEIATNPRARSAKLRVGVRKEKGTDKEA